MSAPRVVSLFAFVAFTALAGSAPAQNVVRVTPQAAEEGDTVILTGSNLQATSQVRFFASVGGFVGTWTVDVAPTSVSATQVTAVVPQMAAFAPPGSSPPGNPVGTVRALTPAGQSNTRPFFYIQATPWITTPGTGTTQPGGIGKPVIGFTIAGGPPQSPNANFVLRLENALPGAGALLFVGAPGTPPFPMVGDGTFVIDPLAPIIVAPSGSADAAGDVSVPAAIPAGIVGLTVTVQWVVTQGGAFYLSNGLEIAF